MTFVLTDSSSWLKYLQSHCLSFLSARGSQARTWDDWRRENIVPMLNKGSKEDPGDYRLVSLTSVPGWIVEHLLKESAPMHLKDNKVIGNSQRGFVKSK